MSSPSSSKFFPLFLVTGFEIPGQNTFSAKNAFVGKTLCALLFFVMIITFFCELSNLAFSLLWKELTIHPAVCFFVISPRSLIFNNLMENSFCNSPTFEKFLYSLYQLSRFLKQFLSVQIHRISQRIDALIYVMIKF